MRKARNAWMLVAGLALAGGPVELRAQGADLGAAERFVEEGRFADARAVVLEWWEATPDRPSRDAQQLAIWLRAILTVDPAIAELDFRRLVVEFPGGAYADRSLLRLAQLSEARGDAPGARRFLEILIRDYPQSPLRVEARSRMARLPTQTTRTEAEVEPAALPVEPPPTHTPVPEAITDSLIAPLGDSVPPPALDPEADPIQDSQPATPVSPAARLPFAIQLGAFSTAERARNLAGQVTAAGYQVRVVQVEGSGLIRVRFGEFESRKDAEVAARAIRGLGFEAVVSSDRRSEVELR